MTTRLTDDELTVLARLLPPGPRADMVLERAGFDEEHRPLATAGMAAAVAVADAGLSTNRSSRRS